MADWSRVTVEHVAEACQLFDDGTALPKRPAKSTFLNFNGKSYPAKFIRGLAYRIATGIELDPSRDFTGGDETARFFAILGLPTSKTTTTTEQSSTPKEQPTQSPTPIPKPQFEPQKQALYRLLVQRFGIVETEAKFPWLTVPSPDDMDDTMAAIWKSLVTMRGYDTFAKSGQSLRCDFYLPKQKLIIEYDERQHFTEQRAKALSLYPSDVLLGFDRSEWIVACHNIRASDPLPPYRDEQRAFYDSLRDIFAVRNGYRLVRIRAGVTDWAAATATLDSVLTNCSTVELKGDRSEINRVGLVSHNYTIADRHGRFDYSDHFAAINAACDQHGCDTILYSLYTWDRRSNLPRGQESIFNGLTNVERIVIEVGEPLRCYDHLEAWTKTQSHPLVMKQRFATSTASASEKHQFIADLPERQIGSALVVVCGESNIVRLQRSTRTWDDSYGFVRRMDELGIKLVLNPIHDYMTRYEMREKRKFYSLGGRTVISVWNKGRGKESHLPWTVFTNGSETTHQVRELPSVCPDRPDIRVGIVDVTG